MVDLGPLNIDTTNLPVVDISTFVPSALGGAGVGKGKEDPLVLNLPRAVTAYDNKYAGDEYAALAAQYPAYAVSALQALDATRASRGQTPLSITQSQKALETVVTGKPQTKPKKRSLVNVVGNIISDASDIVRSVPRIPSALVEEATSIGDIGETIASAPNPIAGLASAPLIRMLPGSFAVEKLARGEPGELARHPLITALDVLPYVNRAARATNVGRVAGEAQTAIRTGKLEVPTPQALQIQKLQSRPIAAALLNRVDDPLEPSFVRSGLGELVDEVAKTRPFRALAQTGQQARDAMYMVASAQQRTRGVMAGVLPSQDMLDTLGRRAVQFEGEFTKTFPEFEGRIAEFHERATVGNYDGLSPREMTAMEMAREWADDTARTLVDEGRAVFFNDELYDLQTGLKLRKLAKDVDETRKFSDLRSVIAAGDADPQALATDMLRTYRSKRAVETRPGDKQAKVANIDAFSERYIRTQHNATIAAIRAGGLDPQPLIDAWRAVGDNPSAYDNILDDIAAGRTTLQPHGLLTYDEIVSKLQTASKDRVMGNRAKQLLESLANGDFKSVTSNIDALYKAKSAPWVDQQMRDSLRALRDTQKLLNKDLVSYTDKAALKAAEKLAKAEVSPQNLPARFIPKVNELALEKLREQMLPIINTTGAERLTLAQLSNMEGFDEAAYRAIAKEAAAQWKSLRDNGFDPIYVHNVSANRAGQVLHPVQAIIPDNPASLKRRTMDMSPGVRNVGVSMTEQARQFLSERNIELAIKDIVDQMSVSEKTLRDQFLPVAQRRAAKNTALDVEGHLERVINENYRKFNPETEGYRWGSPYLKKLASDQPYLPIAVYKNLKSLADPKGFLGGVFDPITSLFRMATTSLSIRTQIYNIIGGAVMMELERPGALLRSGMKAFQMRQAWKRGDLEAIPAPLREALGSQKQTLLDMDKAALGIVNEGVFHHLRGRMLKRFWDDAQAAKKPGTPITSRFGGKIKGLVEKSYDINGAFDDFYRMTTYIDSYNSAIKKGSTSKFAERAAVGQVRKVLQDWMGMTPIERQVMKSIFPFYGFMSHAMRFVYRYPLDHPLRAELISKLAMAELEDQQSLPNRFLSHMFFGGMGPEGERNALNLGPINPFGDVANYMTIQGVLGSTNPVIQTALEMVGVEQGEQSLYPSLRYDPETGRLGVRSSNPLFSLIENTVPQSALLTALLGANAEYNDIARRDPAGAARFIASGLTLPILWRQYNVPQEQIKAELARQESEQEVLQEALKSGDWSEALQYPNLAEYLTALDGMDTTPFTPLSPEDIKAGNYNKDVYKSVTPLTEQLEATQSLPTIALPTAADRGIAALTTRGGI